MNSRQSRLSYQASFELGLAVLACDLEYAWRTKFHYATPRFEAFPDSELSPFEGPQTAPDSEGRVAATSASVARRATHCQ